MKPRKQLIDAATADGSIDRMNSLLSAAHILNCEANMLMEEVAGWVINRKLTASRKLEEAAQQFR